MKKTFMLLLVFQAVVLMAGAQTQATDSLQRLLRQHPQPDTIRVNLLRQLSHQYMSVDLQESYSLTEQALKLSRQIHYKRGEINSLEDLAIIGQFQSEHKKAIAFYEEALSLAKEQQLDKKTIDLLYGMGSTYNFMGNYTQAMAYALEGLKAAEGKQYDVQTGRLLSLMGNIYSQLKDYEQALTYQLRALEYDRKLEGGERRMGSTYNNIGEVYRLKGEYAKAIEAYTQAIELTKKFSGSALAMATYESNLADVYARMGKSEEAFAHGFRSLKLSEKIGDMEGVVWTSEILARSYLLSGNIDSAIYMADRSLQLARQTGLKPYLIDASETLAKAYALNGNHEQAYEMHVLHSGYKDSLFNDENSNRAAVLKHNYDLEKKQAEIALLTKDQELQAEHAQQQRQLLYSLVGGLGLVIVLAAVLYSNNRHKQRANNLLRRQKQEIDQQAKALQELNEEIQASNTQLAEQAEELTLQRDTLEQSYRNVELLGSIGRQLTASLSVETIMATVYENVNKLMDASIFGIGLYNEKHQSIDFPATYEKGERLPFYTNQLDDANRLGVWCFIHVQEVFIKDFEQEYRQYISQILPPKAGENSQSIVYLPLLAKERTIGVLTVQSFHKRAYTEYHLNMLRNLAVYAAIALENAEAYEQLNKTLQELQTTQRQLVQHEKMASLGELTAGIAHEIQNPLNFVNNFSEISLELVQELREEMGGETLTEAGSQNLTAILDDLSQNQEKIHYHGKRADSIVKNMLQHTRASSGEKQLTDLNKLVDEYLRLAYHGLRAKDKEFNATFGASLDPEISQMELVPQDIGRVLLNLFNNAFYATRLKQKLGLKGYLPEVKVTTQLQKEAVEIRVKDNGMGIPEEIRDKIFQPFFTTKPSGQGTGLGLSLSYDIITKGHSGILKVESREGEYAEFIVVLPKAQQGRQAHPSQQDLVTKPK